MTIEHTPGPYLLSDRGTAVMKNDTELAIIPSNHIPPDERIANGLLFAAAPDLLDSLERFIHMAECNTIPGPNTIAQAKAHITKARGTE